MTSDKNEWIKYKGKNVRATYDKWGDIFFESGKLEKINKASVIINGKLVKNVFDIEEEKS